jgi:hypothetical protein
MLDTGQVRSCVSSIRGLDVDDEVLSTSKLSSVETCPGIRAYVSQVGPYSYVDDAVREKRGE